MISESCCAVLLRGGKSRRMGRDKALLPWKGKTWLETIAEQLDPLFSEKYLSVSEETDCILPADWVVLADAVPDCGPIGGILTALQTCRAEWALVSSCDIPAVKTALFQLLLENRAPDADLVFPATADKIHLTCALYRKTMEPLVREQIAQGDYRLRSLPGKCRAREVRITDPAYLFMLTNVNTRADRALLEQKIIPGYTK